LEEITETLGFDRQIWAASRLIGYPRLAIALSALSEAVL
jgi:hypothetical protein